MTLEEYYKAIKNLKAPDNMDWVKRHFYYMEETEKLRSQLSEKDLKVVLEEQRRWEDKMQSGVS
ncbi:MAG: hypothetical protein Q4A00_05650 [Flavobacteriaceae bacterium]|nr:hypothetical protein [Flavobacteriaceae bacterium]